MEIWEDGLLATPAGDFQPGSLWLRAGRIVAIAERPQADWIGRRRRLDGALVTPGFIDVHIHGAGGADALDGTPEALSCLASTLRRHGVTGFLATLASAARSTLEAAFAACTVPLPPTEAELLGVHLEGPYLVPEKAGAQPGSALRLPDPAEYTAWLEHPLMRLITVAPELPGSEALIRAARARGVHVALGHTQADYALARRAADWGAQGITHLFNALPPLHHRQPGTVEAALEDARFFLQLIADGVHVHPAWLRLTLRLAAERTVLISDAIRAAGLPEGSYQFAGQRIEVHAGAARLADGTLAGSVTLLDGALRYLVHSAGLPLVTVLPLLTWQPARLLGLGDRYGRLAPGYIANLTVLDPQSLEVVDCVVRAGAG